MINSMFNALSGMLASAQKLQNSANNLVDAGRNKVPVGDNLKRKLDVETGQSSKINISKEAVDQMVAQAEFTANARVVTVADKTVRTILDVKS